MEPIERLAIDFQTLKDRVDELSLRSAVAEEREKRINDKIDGLVVVINRWASRMGWAMAVVLAVVLAAFARWVLSGSLAGL